MYTRKPRCPGEGGLLRIHSHASSMGTCTPTCRKVHDKQHASQTTTALGASMVCPASHVATNRGRNIDAAQHKEQHSTCLQFVLDATKRNVHQETKVPRRRWAAENTQPCVLYGNVHPNLQGKCTTSSTHHKPQLRLVHPWFALLAT